MAQVSISRIAIPLSILISIAGCGKKPPAEPPVPSEMPAISKAPSTDEPPVLIPTPKSPVGGTPVVKAAPANSPSTAAVAAEKVPFPDAAFLSDDIVGLIVAHPRRIMELPIVQMIKQAGIEDRSGLNIKPESIERITVVIDQDAVNELAGSAGLTVVSLEPSTKKTTLAPVKNQLKQLGLAFHNYEATHQSFPRADAAWDGKNSGLSWRVHLLPYLEQQELYEQFRLDEPWDSDHNKTLIDKMPAVYRSPGTDEPGKTSLHVISGKDTAVNTVRGVRLRDVTDGTSNTLLVVAAGADTAEIWTKPGGLAFDREAPRKSLGDFGETLFAVKCDGAVVPVSADCDDQTLADLFQINDGNLLGNYLKSPVRSDPRPLMILTLVTVDQPAFLEGFLGKSTEEPFEGQSLHKNEFNAVCFYDEKTVLCGPIESVKKLIATHRSGQPGSPEILKQLTTEADFSLCIDLKSQVSLLEQVVDQIPGVGLIQQVEQVSFQFNLSAKPEQKLLELVLTASDIEAVTLLSQLAKVGIMQVNAAITSAPSSSKEDRQLFEMARTAVQFATVTENGNRLELVIAAPKGFEKLADLLRPAFENVAKVGARAEQIDRLREIGLGFLSYHDTYRTFPGAGKSADGKTGLSWRVHILPLIGEDQLYQQFNLEEPWDSEANKKLIEKMPKIYDVKGVEAGKTSVHVFTGPGAPFANNQLPMMNQFTDGTSNTFLVVQAGTDKAEIWTKPGGLDFDPKNPVLSLGEPQAKEFVALFADGSVQSISKETSADNLRRLIQYQDGEPSE